MTVSSSSYKKDFHFVIVGTVNGESKEGALEILVNYEEKRRDKRHK